MSIVMQFNLCVNHTLGLVNTQLIAAYAAIDPRLAKLTAIVKHWAKRRQVLGQHSASYLGCLSCLTQMRSAICPLLMLSNFALRNSEWSTQRMAVLAVDMRKNLALK